MRSVHVDTARTWRGGEQQALYLMDGLRARGHEVLLVTPPATPLFEAARERGIPVRGVRARGDLDPAGAWRLRRALSDRVEVLHLHTARAHAQGLLALLGRRSRPAVVVSRRVDFPVARTPASRLKYGRGVDRFVAVSAAAAGMLVAAGVPEARVTVVHSGVDPARMDVPADPLGLRRELAVPPSAKLVGFVGALVPHKSPEDLLEAMVHLSGASHVVFVGEGERRVALARRARSLGVEGRVHLLGHRDDVPRLVRSVDVFCLPSRQEGLGTSVLDAMAAGTPVVAARGGGIPEMVEDGRSGLLSEPGDAVALARSITRVLEDEDLRRRLTEGGRARVRAFSVDRMVERTLTVYEHVLAERPGERPTGSSPGSSSSPPHAAMRCP